MRIALHAGVHCTDEDKLLRTLLRNADALRARGVAVPGANRYRGLLAGMLAELGDAAPAPEARAVVLDTILDDTAGVDRLVLSLDAVLGAARAAFGEGRIYPNAESRLRALSGLFDGDRVELFIGLRNPATFLPALFRTSPQDSLGQMLAGLDPAALRWSELVARLRQAFPRLRMTLWCNEDTPLIWGEVVRAVAGLPTGSKIAGAFDLLAGIMEPEGMRRFRAYLAEHPTISEAQKRRVMMAFLDKYAMDEALEEDLDIPGWDEAFVNALTAQYDADMARVAAIAGVRLIAP